MFDVFFFDNGNTAHFKDEKQVPELQESWFILYLKFLEEKGINPLDGKYILPGGKTAEIFKTKNGYNWRFKNHENPLKSK